MSKTNLVVAAALLTVSGLLSAGTIADVCGTGYSAGCGGLLGTTGTSQDGNWVLATGTAVETVPSSPFVTDNSTYPFGPWVADTGSAEWISPKGTYSSSGGGDAVGTFTYTETFSLAGYNLSTVDLTGEFANDNIGEIWLNGVDTGVGSTHLAFFTGFNLTSGFNSGVNTIEFVVTNTSATGANPSGLIVELTGTGSLNTVPEPASFAFIGLGLGALGLLGRRLRS
ncbi:MAG: PEP-CTERM sorting domain-containing protein [Bryobacteraceae bacterium]|jgi:PEP-CTERM motif-containing protein